MPAIKLDNENIGGHYTPLQVNYGGGNGAGCFEVKVWMDTAKFTDVIVTRLRKCSDLIREGKVFVEYKTKVK